MLYVLPNLFTLSSVFCGLLAILWVTGDALAVDYYRAAVAILFAAVFDGMDGRVARLTRTQSDLGVQLDSLADVISFGVAPALLVYRWGLEGVYIGRLDVGFALAFIFVAAGALRLARFNVLAQRERLGPSKFFVGLPIPAAACMAAGVIIAHHQTQVDLLHKQVVLLVLLPLLAFLMVSTVPYPTFKHVHFTKRTIIVAVLGFGLSVLVALRTAPSVTVALLLSAYILFGLVAYIVGFPKRLVTRRAARRAARAANAEGAGVPEVVPPEPAHERK